MTTPTQHDQLGELVEMLALLHADDSVPLPWAFLERLKVVLGCECVAFGAPDPLRRTHAFLQAHDWDDEEYHEAGGEFDEDEEARFWSYYWTCEPCSYPDRSGDHRSVIQVADFYSVRQWHSTAMYGDLMRGIEHELILCVDAPGSARPLRLLCLRGSDPPFGDRERALLALLRPHIAESYGDALRRRDTGPGVTARQAELLALVRDGDTNRQIARRLGLSEATVRTHLTHIFERLEVTSRTAAVTRWQELARPQPQAAGERRPGSS